MTTPESLYILLTAEQAAARSCDAVARSSSTRSTRWPTTSAARICALARAAGRAGRPAAPAHRPVGHAEADRGGRRSSSSAPAGRRRSSSQIATGVRSISRSKCRRSELGPDRVERAVGRGLRSARRARPTASLHARLRQHAAACRAHRAPSRPSGWGTTRVAAHHGSLARKIRLDAEQRLKARRGRGRSWRPRRSSSASTSAPSISCARSARRDRSRRPCSASAAPATGAARCPKGRLFATTRDDLIECAALVLAIRRGELDRLVIPTRRSTSWRSRSSRLCAADDWRRRRSVRARARARIRIAICRAHGFRRGRRDADARASPRAAAGAAPTCIATSVNDRVRGRRGAGSRPITGGGAIPETARLPGRRRAGGHRRSARWTRTSPSRAWPATSCCSATRRGASAASQRGRVHRRGCARRGADDSVLERRGAGPHDRAVAATSPRFARRSIGSPDDDAAGEGSGADAASPRPADRSGRCRLADGSLRPRSLGRRAGRRLRAHRAAPCLGAVPTQQTRHRRTVLRRGRRDAAASSTRRLARASTRPGASRCASGSADRSTSSCRPPRPTTASTSRSPSSTASRSPTSSTSCTRTSVQRRARAGGAARAASSVRAGAGMPAASLALPRFRAGKRVPLHIQRMHVGRPAGVRCSPTRPRARRTSKARSRSPIIRSIREVMKDVLTEAMDLEGLKALLDSHRRRHASSASRWTRPVPSPFSHEILNANPYAYLDDAPLEERRARAVELRRSLPASVLGEVGRLDPAAIAEVVRDAWPDVRDADELNDVLQTLIAVPAGSGEWTTLYEELAASAPRHHSERAGHARTGSPPSARRTFSSLFPDARFETVLPGVEAVVPLVMRRCFPRCADGWRTSDRPRRVSSRIASGLSVDDVDGGLLRLESSGAILRGSFHEPAPASALSRPSTEWCDRRLLARIHRLTLGALRREIEPDHGGAVHALAVPLAARRTGHAADGRARHARGAAAAAGIRGAGQRVGAAGCWPAESPDTIRKCLDDLCLTGAVGWGGCPHLATVTPTSRARSTWHAPGRRAERSSAESRWPAHRPDERGARHVLRARRCRLDDAAARARGG